jgi:hypothetical protein
MTSHTPVELLLYMRRAVPGTPSIGVSEEPDAKTIIFLPRAEITWEEVRVSDSGALIIEVTLPEWLADDRGLSGLPRDRDTLDLFGGA